MQVQKIDVRNDNQSGIVWKSVFILSSLLEFF